MSLSLLTLCRPSLDWPCIFKHLRVSSKLSLKAQADHHLFVYRRFGCLPSIHTSFGYLPAFSPFGHWLYQFLLLLLLLWSTLAFVQRLLTSIRIFTLSSCDHYMGWVRFWLWHGDPDASHQPFDFLYYRRICKTYPYACKDAFYPRKGLISYACPPCNKGIDIFAHPPLDFSVSVRTGS